MDLLSLLSHYKPIDERDAEQTRRLREFVEKNKNCFDRNFPPGHITGSAWLVDQTGTHVLLTHHKKLGKWLQLGGHADGDQNIMAVALREAREESGLSDVWLLSEEIFDVDVHLIPAHTREPEHYHYDVRFILKAPSDSLFQVSDESHALSWVEIDRLHEFTQEESLLRMARKWISLRKKLLPPIDSDAQVD